MDIMKEVIQLETQSSPGGNPLADQSPSEDENDPIKLGELELDEDGDESPLKGPEDQVSLIKSYGTAQEQVQDIVAEAWAKIFDNRPLLLSGKSHVLDVESIQAIVKSRKGQQQQPHRFTPDAMAFLAMDATFAAKFLLQEADKFREMGKRRSLQCSDTDHAVKIDKMENPLIGFGMPYVYNYMLRGKVDAHFEENTSVTLETLAEDHRKCDVPVTPVVHSHWLITVDDQDTALWPEPDLILEETSSEEQAPTSPASPTLTSMTELISDAVEECGKENMDPIVHEDVIIDPGQVPVVTSSDRNVDAFVGRKLSFKLYEMIHLRSQSRGKLTKEQELYFQTIASSCFTYSKDKQSLAFSSLEHDPVMVLMLGYWSCLIFEQTEENVINPSLRRLQVLMTMVKSLILNRHIENMKEYLHELLPPVMTCIVCTTICTPLEVGEHWQLRNFAGDLVRLICEKHSTPVNRIRERVVNVLRGALRDQTKELSTIYGALYTLKGFGFDVLRPDLTFLQTVLQCQVDDLLKNEALQLSASNSNAGRIKELIVQILAVKAKEDEKLAKLAKKAQKSTASRTTKRKRHDATEEDKSNKIEPDRPVEVASDSDDKCSKSRKKSASKTVSVSEPAAKKKAPSSKRTKAPKIPPPPPKPSPYDLLPGQKPMPIPRFPPLRPPRTYPNRPSMNVGPATPRFGLHPPMPTARPSFPAPRPFSPLDLFHTYALKTAPKPQPIPRKLPVTSQQVANSSSSSHLGLSQKNCVEPLERPRESGPSSLPHTSTWNPKPARLLAPRVMMAPASRPSPHYMDSDANAASMKKYVLIPVQRQTRIPSAETLNSLIRGQVPPKATIVSPGTLVPPRPFRSSCPIPVQVIPPPTPGSPSNMRVLKLDLETPGATASSPEKEKSLLVPKTSDTK